MRSPTVTEFLQQHQTTVKSQTKKGLLKAPDMNMNTINTNETSQASLFCVNHPAEQKATRRYQNTNQQSELHFNKQTEESQINKSKQDFLSVPGDKNLLLTTTHNTATRRNTSNNGPSDYNLDASTISTPAQITDKLQLEASCVPVLFSNYSRRSAFQETGAGDVQSILAVRAITQVDSNI